MRAYHQNVYYDHNLFYTSYEISFTLRDECLGWEISPASLTTTKKGTFKLFQGEEAPFVLEKYLLSPDSNFAFPRLTYYKQDFKSENTECGELLYDWGFWTSPLKAEMLARPDPELTDLLFEASEQFNFVLSATEKSLVGTHFFSISTHLGGTSYQAPRLEEPKTF